MTDHTGRTHVLVVADDLLTRAGLAALLADDRSATVVGQATSDADAEEYAVYGPDVVVWDLGRHPDVPTSLDRLASLAETGLSIVALLPDDVHAAAVCNTGVRGLLRREIAPPSLRATLLAVAQGLTVLDPSMTAALLKGSDPSPRQPAEELTQRELEVLQLLADGLTNKAIAQRLEISEHTVKFHVNAILGKLNAQSRTEAAVRATRLGLIFV